jgi:hypothetical protein
MRSVTMRCGLPLALAVSCAPAAGPLPPPVSPPAVPAVTSLSALPAVSSAPPVPLPPPPEAPPSEARLVSVRVTAREARVVAVPLRRALPAFAKCSASAAWIDVALDVDVTGAPSGIAVAARDPSVTACARGVVEGLRFDPQKDAKLVAWIRVGPPLADGALRELGPSDTLVPEPDGTCAGLEVHDCPPHKMCMAPQKYAARCPVELGLPPLLEPGAASRRLEIGVSGGKPGQGSETLIFAVGGDGCSLRAAIDAIEPTQPSGAALDDVPCAELERVWRLARARFAGKRPQETHHPDEVSHWVTFQSPAGFEAVRWSGQSAANADFTALVDVAGPIAAARSSLRLWRLVR